MLPYINIAFFKIKEVLLIYLKIHGLVILILFEN